MKFALPKTDSDLRRLSLGFDICHLKRGASIDGNSSVISNLANRFFHLKCAGKVELNLYALDTGVLDGVPDRDFSRVLGSVLPIQDHRLVRYCLPFNLLKDRPDIFLNVAGGYQPLYVPTKQISIVHDIAFELDEWKPYYTDQLRSFLSINTAAAVKRADGFAAVSERTRQDLIEFYGLPPEKVKVIYNGYDESSFNETPTDADEIVREKLGGEPYFLSVGTLQPRKNYVRLIEAFAKVKRQLRMPHRLIIVGANGWLAEESVEAARRHEGDGVVLWGHAKQQDLPALYRNAFAMVFPALYEGFGIPAVEAMACGIPVIGSETGSLGEVIGDYGILFSPYSVESIAEAMSLLIEDGSAVPNLKARSRERAKHFSWEKSAREYLEFSETIAFG